MQVSSLVVVALFTLNLWIKACKRTPHLGVRSVNVVLLVQRMVNLAVPHRTHLYSLRRSKNFLCVIIMLRTQRYGHVLYPHSSVNVFDSFSEHICSLFWLPRSCHDWHVPGIAGVFFGFSLLFQSYLRILGFFQLMINSSHRSYEPLAIE
jgi:hypothetical protein